jgi:LysR family hydrogen peroxide-inducible transcriptional activator
VHRVPVTTFDQPCLGCHVRSVIRFSTHPMTLRQLQYVVAVAEHHSFRKASQACAVSQPALSAQVAQLENALGFKVFDRNTASVHLTGAGVEFVERARQLLRDADRLVDEALRAADPLSGPVRIGVIPTVGPYLLPEVALPLREKFPRLRFAWVEDRTASLARQLKEGLLDGAIVALETDELGEVESVTLGTDPFLLATPHEHPLSAADTPVSTDVLAGEHVLVLEDGHCLGDQVLDVCARARAGELDVCGTSLATLSQMVVGGVGVTLMPALAQSVENRLGTMHVRPFLPDAQHTPQVPARTLALAWRRGASAAPTLQAIAPVLAAPIERTRANL